MDNNITSPELYDNKPWVLHIYEELPDALKPEIMHFIEDPSTSQLETTKTPVESFDSKTSELEIFFCNGIMYCIKRGRKMSGQFAGNIASSIIPAPEYSMAKIKALRQTWQSRTHEGFPVDIGFPVVFATKEDSSVLGMTGYKTFEVMQYIPHALNMLKFLHRDEATNMRRIREQLNIPSDIAEEDLEAMLHEAEREYVSLYEELTKLGKEVDSNVPFDFGDNILLTISVEDNKLVPVFHVVDAVL